MTTLNAQLIKNVASLTCRCCSRARQQRWKGKKKLAVKAIKHFHLEEHKKKSFEFAASCGKSHYTVLLCRKSLWIVAV